MCIVAVDDGWGMERSAHRFKGVTEARYQGTDISPGTRYDLIAEAMGCHGEHVTTIDELRPAIDRAVDSGRPAVIHVRVDPELDREPDRLRAVPEQPAACRGRDLHGRRVFVTGASGFVGRALVAGFGELGAEVRGIDVEPDPGRSGRGGGHHRSRSGWSSLLDGCDVVIHTAAIINDVEPSRAWYVNVVGTQRVLEAAKEAGT